MADTPFTAEQMEEFLVRGRLGQPGDSAEIVAELARAESEARARVKDERKNAVLEGDVEIDPTLLEQGDEVAEEVVSEYKKQRWFHFDSPEHLFLVEQDSTKRVHGSASKFTPEQQRNACQRVADLMFEQDLPKGRAFALVGAELGVTATTIGKWVEKCDIELPVPQNKVPRAEQWGIIKREELFDRQLGVASLLIDRLMVRLQHPEEAPEGWDAANELKTIAVASGIAHDKRTGIEDIKAQRGLRDVESEDLKARLDAGRQRLLEMGVPDGDEEGRSASGEGGEAGEGTVLRAAVDHGLDAEPH
jgi:hypothetical protein